MTSDSLCLQVRRQREIKRKQEELDEKRRVLEQQRKVGAL